MNWDNLDSEEQLIEAIKAELLTEDQRALLYWLHLDVAACLNGNYTGDQEAAVEGLFAAWNERIGRKVFGW